MFSTFYIDIYILNKKKTSAVHKNIESLGFLGPSFSKRSWNDELWDRGARHGAVTRAMKSSSRFPLDSDLIGWEGAVGGVCLMHGWWAAASSSGTGGAGTPATSETELKNKVGKSHVIYKVTVSMTSDHHVSKYWYYGMVFKDFTWSECFF